MTRIDTLEARVVESIRHLALRDTKSGRCSHRSAVGKEKESGRQTHLPARWALLKLTFQVSWFLMWQNSEGCGYQSTFWKNGLKIPILPLWPMHWLSYQFGKTDLWILHSCNSCSFSPFAHHSKFVFAIVTKNKSLWGWILRSVDLFPSICFFLQQLYI